MEILKIIEYPDPRLRLKAMAVEDFNDIQHIVDIMLHTMNNTPNTAAIAATQLNIQKRIVVVDPSTTEGDTLVIVNPEILESGSETTLEAEGCLSVPGGIYEKVERPKWIKGRYHDRHGKLIEFEDDGFFARCFQHELDHLNGIVFVDHLSPLKRKRIDKKLAKWRK